MSETPHAVNVFGLPVHLHSDYSSWLLDCWQKGQGQHVVTLNAEMVMQAEQNYRLASIIRQADLAIPDGSGITFYFWLQGQKVRRCPGIEIAEALLSRAEKFSPSLAAFFYGGQPGVATDAAQKWQERSPGLVIGAAHGFLNEAEQVLLQETLKKQQPAIILVGLGVPRQEFWIAEHRHLCPQSIWIGVGGSFDIWAGQKSRAPLWLRNHHLEWVYRLYQEPWRWRRMLALPRFVGRSLAHRLRQGLTLHQQI